LGLSELAEEHGHELSPAGEPSGMALGAVLADQLLKFQARKQLEDLRENAAYSLHGGTSSVEIDSFGKNHKLNL
jgi:hypothetical protein